ncbi:unnamed protein product [Dovyalis caffra]|uniref:Uncharacterized protein n=1 Tax=Dovyalis caffra TaxID=77055 RepID=A0AAV1RZ09_9ROSI|nr:unnamed protein product [Dovyalis caffra]
MLFVELQKLHLPEVTSFHHGEGEVVFVGEVGEAVVAGEVVLVGVAVGEGDSCTVGRVIAAAMVGAAVVNGMPVLEGAVTTMD